MTTEAPARLYQNGDHIIQAHTVCKVNATVWKITDASWHNGQWWYLCSAPYLGNIRVYECDVRPTSRKQFSA